MKNLSSHRRWALQHLLELLQPSGVARPRTLVGVSLLGYALEVGLGHYRVSIATSATFNGNPGIDPEAV